MTSDTPHAQRGFKLGTPALVCRWRLSNRKLPMANRHLRALGHRIVNGRAVAPQLVAWAKQHVEWTLEDGSAAYPDGVLMLVVDSEGRAAMTVGPFEELGRMTVNDLMERALMSLREASETGVAPESLWASEGDALVCGLPSDLHQSGAATLIFDLAHALGMTVRIDEELLNRVRSGVEEFDEIFLVSDEFGVVPASNAGGARSQKLAASYQKLLDSMRR